MTFDLRKLIRFISGILFVYFIFTANIQSVSGAFDYEYVTVGSAFKLLNQGIRVRLHSHEVTYGSGSGQQSVTGMDKKEDGNSYWQVRSPTDETLVRGTPIKCGQNVRLTHLTTSKNLHSHHFRAPLSSYASEVSCFGNDGDGDDLDNWQVQCSGSLWSRNQFVSFKHVETGFYLTCSDQKFGRPIAGQHEIIAADNLGKKGKWKTVEGAFIKPVEEENNS